MEERQKSKGLRGWTGKLILMAYTGVRESLSGNRTDQQKTTAELVDKNLQGKRKSTTQDKGVTIHR